MADEHSPTPVVGAGALVEAVSDASTRLDRAISAWLAEHIHNSPVSRATEAFNHLVSVLAHLKANLIKEV